jgi:hypothetical protein
MDVSPLASTVVQRSLASQLIPFYLVLGILLVAWIIWLIVNDRRGGR